MGNLLVVSKPDPTSSLTHVYYMGQGFLHLQIFAVDKIWLMCPSQCHRPGHIHNLKSVSWLVPMGSGWASTSCTAQHSKLEMVSGFGVFMETKNQNSCTKSNLTVTRYFLINRCKMWHCVKNKRNKESLTLVSALDRFPFPSHCFNIVHSASLNSLHQ